MSKLNLFGSGFTESTLNINQNLNIDNYLRVYEVLGVNIIQIDNFGYIEGDLNLNKDIDISEPESFPILQIEKNGKDTLIINNELNCNADTKFTELSSLEDIIIKLEDNYASNIKINSDINLYNKAISDFTSINKTQINNKNTVFTKNIVVDNETLMSDCDVFKINCNNYVTQNLDIHNNANCDQFFNIKINNDLNISGNANLVGNTNIDNSLTVNGRMKFSENSRFLLPKKSRYNQNNIPLKGSLRYNDERKSIEYYTDTWKSISSFHSSDYKTFIKIYENNNTNSSNNIEFYQNNLLGIELNNNTYNLNIYKPLSNFKSNLNISGVINNFPNNLYVNNLITNKNTFINKLLVLGNYNVNNINNVNNVNESISDGTLRFNESINSLQIYNKGFGKLNFYSDISGINVKEDDNINIFFNKNKILCNNNLHTFTKNVNINSNLNITNFATSKNTNIKNNIIFNNKSILRYKDNKLEAFVAPNYNTTTLENYEFFDVNQPNTNIQNINIEYVSHILYTRANTNNYNYLLNTYAFDNNFIINKKYKFIFIPTTNTNILLNKLEIKYFISNSNNIEHIELLNLVDLKSKYNVLIIHDEKIIYDSESNINSVLLKKNSHYNIQIKLKYDISTISKDLLLFIRLCGSFYTDSIYNQNIDFIYKIDNKFKNDVEFLNDLNLYKKSNFKKSLLSNKYYHSNIFINSNTDSNTNSNTDLLNVNNFLVIKNNNIEIGRGINSELINNNRNIIIKTPQNKNSMLVNGNCIVSNLNVKNNVSITSNCSSITLNYNHLNTNTIQCNSDTNINQNINCVNMNIKNIIYNDLQNNLLQKTNTTSLLLKDKIYNLDKLVNNNINISNNVINFKNVFRFDHNSNISINSEEIYDAFSVGNKLRPNLSISHNGFTQIYTTQEGFILDNINVFNKFNELKSIN